MSGTGGLFTHKIELHSFFDNAGGLRVGAPVRLEGVDVGNVTKIAVDPSRKADPVVVTYKVTSRFPGAIRQGATAMMSTAGVLGETFVDIDSRQAGGPEVKDGDTLAAKDQPDFNDVVRASQGTLQNVDILVKRVDRIVGQIESGNGNIGKLIY